jgi:shikimate dehydrogenase
VENDSSKRHYNGRRSVLFVGMETGGSRDHGLFPHWMVALGREASLEGLDLPLDTRRPRYRALVESIVASEKTLGAVVTSRKLALYASCADLFAETDYYGELAHEARAA